MSDLNDYSQPIGVALGGWAPPPAPVRQALHGRFCRIEPLQAPYHGSELHQANCLDLDASAWTYLPYGPFKDKEAYLTWLEGCAQSEDPLFFAIIDSISNRAVGLASYLRITPVMGVIEVGHLKFSRLLQRSPAATEAMYLMMKASFELGYRRYEWKCDALNAPSRAAAKRLGFSFEGIFRQAVVYKGRNRDTAWYSIIDSEWPALKNTFEQWLAPENFDADGTQRRRLEDIRHDKR